MTGKDAQEVFEEVLPSALIEEWCKELGVVERERKLEIGALVRSMVIATGTPSGAVQADVLRAYLEYEVEPVARSAFYQWFDGDLERLMGRLAGRALDFARRQKLDLPGPLAGVTDWIIVDSTTAKLADALFDEYPGTGDYAAIKVHKQLSVGCGAPVSYHFSAAREHDSKHLEINESWAGFGLLADLGYAKLSRLRACVEHDVSFVIRLKDNWKAKVDHIARGEVTRTFFPGTDLDVLLEDETLKLNGRAIDADVRVGKRGTPIELRLVGVPTPKGYCFFLTNLPPRIGPLQVGQLYRVRWEVELSMKLDKSVNRLDKVDAESGCAVRTLLHAALISSAIAALLTHKHNLGIARRQRGKTRKEAPLHVRLVALQMASSSARIADAFELDGEAAKRQWDRIAKTLTHSGKDPNWRRRPSPLDELRGWKRQPKKRGKSAREKRARA